MDQLVLLVIIGLISLVNWVMQKAAEKREQAKLEREEREAGKQSVYRQPPPQGRKTERRARAPQQDPLKELMEALGLPPEAAAPQPVAPHAKMEAEEFASMESVPLPIPHPAPAASKPRWQPPSIRRPDEKAAKLAAAFAAKEKATSDRPRPASVRELLADRTSKRHAVVLAEILGPPRALQSAL
jgi:cytoskeletal protein RodZ